MNTQENNKLIAEFMGHKLGLDGDGMGEPQCRIFEKGLGTKRIEDTYSKSWDWLMPVVDEIFSLGYDYEIKPRYMVIKERLSSEVLVSKCFVYDKSQKEIIYDAVIEFINQYNKNK